MFLIFDGKKLLVVMALLALDVGPSCDRRRETPRVDFSRCEDASDCPHYLPECRVFAAAGESGSVCTKPCSDASECQIAGVRVAGACVRVTSTGEPDPVNGEGICVAACSGDACPNGHRFMCVSVADDPDNESVCAPVGH